MYLVTRAASQPLTVALLGVVITMVAARSVKDYSRAFLTALSAHVEICEAAMRGEDQAVSPTEQARQLDRKLQQFRVSAKPLLAGVAGLAGRRSIRRALRIFAACDRYGRSLARSSEQYRDPVGSQALASAFTSAAAQTRANVDALIAIIDGDDGVRISSATDELDAAETLARHEDGHAEPRPETRRFLTAVHALRQIERAIVTAATNLGARDGLQAPDAPVTAPAGRRGSSTADLDPEPS
jgi:hypothetical protein